MKSSRNRSPNLVCLLGSFLAPICVAITSPAFAEKQALSKEREIHVSDPCAKMSTLPMKEILKYGPVQGGYAVIKKGDLVPDDVRWIEERSRTFMHLSTVIYSYESKPGSLGVAIGTTDAQAPVGIPVHQFSGRQILRNAVDIRNQLSGFCERKSPVLFVSDVTFHVRADVKASEDKANRDYARLLREDRRMALIIDKRRAAQAKAKAKAAPSIEEADAVLKARWAQFGSMFDLDTTQFGRVRNFACKRSRGMWMCKTGVTALSSRGPEYEERELDWRRDPQGQWTIIDHSLDGLVIIG